MNVVDEAMKLADAYADACTMTFKRKTRAALETRLRELLEGEAVAWRTDEYETDKSATTYSKEIANRWQAKCRWRHW